MGIAGHGVALAVVLLLLGASGPAQGVSMPDAGAERRAVCVTVESLAGAAKN